MGAWVAVVGDDAARHSTPVRLSRSGVLAVACSSGGWAQELDMRRHELLELLRERCPIPAVARLRFSVADHLRMASVEDVAPAPPPRPPAIGPRDRRLGAEVAQGVSDPQLRALVERAAAVSSARHREAQRGDIGP